MRPWHVVGGWAAGLTAYAFILLGFTLTMSPSTPWAAVLYLGSAALVAAFGLAVLLAARRGGEHATQRRQPRRATAAVFLAIGIAVATLGLAYGWVIPLVAVYPLGMAVWMLRGERLPAHARPWPATVDPEPAAPPPPKPPTHEVSTATKVGLGVVLVRTIVKLVRRPR